jgi:hypothetical protein
MGSFRLFGLQVRAIERARPNAFSDAALVPVAPGRQTVGSCLKTRIHAAQHGDYETLRPAIPHQAQAGQKCKRLVPGKPVLKPAPRCIHTVEGEIGDSGRSQVAASAGYALLNWALPTRAQARWQSPPQLGCV